jgi:hypothetical protein
MHVSALSYCGQIEQNTLRPPRYSSRLYSLSLPHQLSALLRVEIIHIIFRLPLIWCSLGIGMKRSRAVSEVGSRKSSSPPSPQNGSRRKRRKSLDVPKLILAGFEEELTCSMYVQIKFILSQG